MRSSAAEDAKPHRRNKVSFVTLTALFVLAAGTQALAPATAAAVTAEGGGSSVCIPLPGSLEHGTTIDGRPCEVINVTGTAPAPEPCPPGISLLCLPGSIGGQIPSGDKRLVTGPVGGGSITGLRPNPETRQKPKGKRAQKVAPRPKPNPEVCPVLREVFKDIEGVARERFTLAGYRDPDPNDTTISPEAIRHQALLADLRSGRIAKLARRWQDNDCGPIPWLADQALKLANDPNSLNN
jgi:hypothetical protein